MCIPVWITGHSKGLIAIQTAIQNEALLNLAMKGFPKSLRLCPKPGEIIVPFSNAQDLTTVELHLLDTGHFALEEESETIASHIRHFIPAHVG